MICGEIALFFMGWGDRIGVEWGRVEGRSEGNDGCGGEWGEIF